ncbi:MAG: radical SAM/Cys-rich domain protein [Oceanicoccus sp.]|uniref:arsenosugar biosynthesis radical SAM (seleno)protein ArsS n=1 Tax=Oceanicoccus sp. TaxID=2691044 RepID=UPI0026338D7A|nr:arsenosugar biosynthesis radical SAM (seleno)protein ArsS [Oceanicoccus sp.]MCP3907529.1 radical SAM/Cys-rich domain protein [Oceanicoccus sp.]
MLDSRPLLLATDFPPIKRGHVETLQVNLGYLCNLSCVHCHVNAGPSRTELMDLPTIELILQYIDQHNIKVLDLTGGAPEMNPHFRYLVTEARHRGVEVIDRCNLTILLEPEYAEADLAEFLAEQGVVVTASLPCYSEENVEKQRGKGVYDESIEALLKLNALGYGIDPDKPLNLVYNPVGAVLPPPQEQLQADYKRELKQRFGIEFNQLFTITNMPISRFGSVLMSHNEFDAYMELLKNNFSSDNLTTVMCRSLISIDWQGYVYDCDFNQMLEMPLIANDRAKTHLSDIVADSVVGSDIYIGDHCFGCTAGQGSSCSGALND